jgi:hypothetical protein
MCKMRPLLQVEAKKRELRRLFTVMAYVWCYGLLFLQILTRFWAHKPLLVCIGMCREVMIQMWRRSCGCILMKFCWKKTKGSFDSKEYEECRSRKGVGLKCHAKLIDPIGTSWFPARCRGHKRWLSRMEKIARTMSKCGGKIAGNESVE